MSDKNDSDSGIEDEAQTLFESERNALDDVVLAPPAPIKSGLGWGAVLPLFLLAGIGGAVGGWALTQYVMPKYIALPAAQSQQTGTPKINLQPLTSRIDALETKLAAQSSELSFLSSEVKSGSASVTVAGVGDALDITPLIARLEQMETRLDKAARPDLGDTSPVTNDSGEAISASDYLDGLEDRLVTLEKSFSEKSFSEKSLSEISGPDAVMADGQSTEINIELRAELESIRARMAELETQVEAASALAAAPTIVRDTVLLPPFPREELLAAMTAPRDQGEQSWLDKTLKKHISVRNPEDVARAQGTLDEIETLTASREYGQALALIELMPSDVRSIAAEWTAAVKAEIETP